MAEYSGGDALKSLTRHSSLRNPREDEHHISILGEDQMSKSEEEWLAFVKNEAEKFVSSKKSQGGRKFPKVPAAFRPKERNHDSFIPSVVCIGPYHYKNEKLRQLDLKAVMATEFQKDIYSPELVLERVEEFACHVREDYNGGSESEIISNKKQFARMMFLDGCFILQFIAGNYGPLKDMMNDHFINNVRRDLLLLENQLPFQVLQLLMSYNKNIKFSPDRWVKMAYQQFGRALSKSKYWDNRVPRLPDIQFQHLLALFHAQMTFLPEVKSESGLLDCFAKEKICLLLNCFAKGEKEKENKGEKRLLDYSAKELRQVGVQFEPSKTPFLQHIKYRRTCCCGGKLQLPMITIDEHTKSMLLNLVAYEYSCKERIEERWFTSYICFLDSLINDAEDVEVLKSSGILSNFRETDEAAANIFNEVGTYLVRNPDAYYEAKKGINKHYNSRAKRWIAEFWQDYFKSPWTVIAIIAASITIFLTAVQTYFSAFS